MKKLLLTGATGVVGSFIVENLASLKDIEVLCLIRGENPAQRVQAVFEFLKIAQPSHIRAISGDITVENFGIKDSLSGITHIIHCASSVDLTMSMDEALKHTVFPTEQVLKIQKQNPGCKLDYVSTVGVNGRMQKPLSEGRILEGRDFFNTYEEGKSAAEILLYKAIDQGQKITIHRPSMVIGHSQDGRIIGFQVFYHIVRLLAGFYTRGLQPDIRPFRLDTIPVDFVAKAIVTSMQKENSAGMILNICSGFEGSPTLGRIQDLARESFRKYKVPTPGLVQIPLGVFAFALQIMAPFVGTESRKRFQILQQLLSYAQLVQPFENMQTVKTYESWGLKLPSAESYLGICLSEYARRFSLRGKPS